MRQYFDLVISGASLSHIELSEDTRLNIKYYKEMNERNHSLARTTSSSSQRAPKYFYQFRVIIIGDSTVGKSSLIRQFTEGSFVDTFPADPTVGVDFHVRVIEITGE